MRRPSALLAIVAIIVGWTAAIVLVDPRADVPLLDDWLYAANIERLVAGRGLDLNPWLSTVPLAQLAWGALFAAVAGFSYTVARVSTLVAAAGGLVACFGLLRVLGLSVERALLGAATLALYPVWFVLAFTVMTDVPFVALACASVCALAAALQAGDRTGEHDRAMGSRLRRPAVLLIVGLALAVVAFLVRPVAIAIPAALLVALMHRAVVGGGSRRRNLSAAVAALATVVAMAGTAVLVGRVWPTTGGEGGLAYRVERLRWVLAVSPWIYLEALCSMLAHLGLATLPLLVVTQKRVAWRTAAVLLVVAAAVSYAAPSTVNALKPQATWSAQELGAARPLLRGVPVQTLFRSSVAVVATLVGLVAAACLLARFGTIARTRRASPEWTLLLAFGAASVAICFVLWFFYDRYFLPVVPVAIALALTNDDGAARTPVSSAPRPSARLVAAALVFVVLALLDVTGTRDMLAYARAIDGAVASLRSRGVTDDAIDAGYVENGWRLYVHPEHLAPGQDREHDIPNLNGAERLPFVIANAPVEGYDVVDTIRVPTWWAQGDRIVVLRRADATNDVRRP